MHIAWSRRLSSAPRWFAPGKPTIWLDFAYVAGVDCGARFRIAELCLHAAWHDIEAVGLFSLMGLASLKHLNLSLIGHGVTNIVLKQVVTCLTSLTHLDLSELAIDDAGLIALGPLANVSHAPLEYLVFANTCYVTNRGLLEVAEFSTLHELDVTHCPNVTT